MKKILALLLVLSLVLFCASCGQTADSSGDAENADNQNTEQDASEDEQTGETEAAGESGDSGLLSADEIASLEALYGQDQSGLLEGLGLTEADAASNDVSVTLVNPRSIENQSFTVRYDLYTVDPGGMYEVTYSLGLSDDNEDAAALVRTIYEEAVAEYGEPSTYEGLEGRISQSLEEMEESGITGSYQDEWVVSEQTCLNMEVALYEDDDMVVISLTYQMEPEEN